MAALRDRLRRRLLMRHDATYDALRLDLEATDRRAAAPLAYPVTSRLRARLGAVDSAALSARLDAGTRTLWETAPAEARPHLELALALHADLPGAAERTGLSAAMPPDGVHLMGSGASATGGSYYHADLVAEAVERAGLSLERARTLDFGCSSGRVVRVLRAAYPDADLHGCDPIGEAIAWAAENVPGVAFLHQDPDSPLPYPDDRFDVVFAISIWSHFGREAGPAWLAEMARVVRPGGLLVMTTQGWFTLARAAAERSWGPAHLGMVARDLVSSGFHFFPCFGPGGDYGVVGDWGMAYLTLEWLLEHAPGWSIVGYAQGRNEGNQDVVVLRREDAVR